MARGKYLSLEEARKMRHLDRFANEHPSVGDKKLTVVAFTYVVGEA